VRLTLPGGKPAAILLGLVGGLIVASAWLNPAAVSGRFWSDGATYYAMTLSLVADGDLRYEAKDVARVRSEYPGGPQGIFLKRTKGALTFDAAAGFPWMRFVRPDEKRVYFAKAFAYPVAAAPFVLVMGSRGLIVCNAALLGLALWLVFGELCRAAGPWRALVGTLGLFVGTVLPVYVVWMTPEIFNFAFIAFAFVALKRRRPLLSAVLLAVAVYSKPYNVLLALPLGLLPFFERERGGFAKRLAESLRRGVVLAGVTALLFGLNILATGEANYQGGERKTFHVAAFPFEGRMTFGNSGEWMTTNQLGPKQSGVRDGLIARGLALIGVTSSDDESAGSGAPQPHYTKSEQEISPEEAREAFPLNLVYFWLGRFGGAALYYFPIALAALVFVIRGPRERLGWLGLLALVVSYVFYVRMMPDNWYGGGGTIGNRYFTNLLPLVILFLPRGRELLVGAIGAVVGGVFVLPLLLAPLHYPLHGGQHTLLPQFRVAPVELTMLNDLTIFGELWRKKQAFGDVGEEEPRTRPPAATAYYLYFPDDSAYGREDAFGGPGFWLRGGSEGQVILRTLAPVARLKVRLLAGPGGDRVKMRVGADSARFALREREERVLTFALGPGVLYHGDRLHVLNFRSADGVVVNDPRPRRLGTFVQLELEPAGSAARKTPGDRG
jgi:hypothetical protein